LSTDGTAIERTKEMIRNLKCLGAVLIALLAMSSLASTASAQFESEAESTNMTVSANAMFKIAPVEGATPVECTKVAVTGTQTGKSNTTITLTPTLSSCETYIGTNVSIRMNGCAFVFHLAKGSTTGTMDIECPTSAVIELIAGNICRYTIGTQTGLSSVSFTNVGAGTTREIVLEPNVKGLTTVLVTNHFFCPAGGKTGTITGSLNLTGENAAGTTHIGVFVD
jgi:hypothetical protein